MPRAHGCAERRLPKERWQEKARLSSAFLLVSGQQLAAMRGGQEKAGQGPAFWGFWPVASGQSARWHLFHSRVQVALVPRRLVAMDHTLRDGRIDDRAGRLQIRRGFLLVPGIDRSDNVLDGGAQLGTSGHIAGSTLDSLTGALFGGLDIGHGLLPYNQNVMPFGDESRSAGFCANRVVQAPGESACSAAGLPPRLLKWGANSAHGEALRQAPRRVNGGQRTADSEELGDRRPWKTRNGHDCAPFLEQIHGFGNHRSLSAVRYSLKIARPMKNTPKRRGRS